MDWLSPGQIAGMLFCCIIPYVAVMVGAVVIGRRIQKRFLQGLLASVRAEGPTHPRLRRRLLLFLLACSTLGAALVADFILMARTRAPWTVIAFGAIALLTLVLGAFWTWLWVKRPLTDRR